MKIARVYLDCDLRCSFDGLNALLKKDGVEIASSPGNFVLFMNRKATAFKLLTANSYLMFYRSPSGRIALDAIQNIPEFFDGTRLDFNKAVEKTVKEKLRIGV